MTNYSGFINVGLQIGLDTILVKPKRGLFNIVGGDGSSLPDIIAHATIEEIPIDEMEITEHPIEQGAAIADHAFKRPAEITLHIAWSNSPNKDAGLVSAAVSGAATSNAAARRVANAAGIAVAGAQAFTMVQASMNGSAIGQMKDIYNKLLKLQANKAIFDLYTGKRLYNNMMCRSLSAPTDYKTENSLFVTMVCRQLIIVNTETVQLPKSVQANPAETASPVNNGIIAATPSKDLPLPASAGQASSGTW